MEVNRRYEYEADFIPLLCKWLFPNPKTSSVVVDVGCGSGYFTRIIAGCLKRRGQVIGIDPDRNLVKAAENITRAKRVQNARFKVGSAWKIPLESDYADLVVSHVVLSNIPRQFEAVLEVKRVAKVGGRVVVIDSAKGGGQYFPDEKLNELARKFLFSFGTAIDKEWRSQFGTSTCLEDFNLKIPELFLKAGLTGITMNGHLSTFLLCDARRSTKEMREHLKAKLVLWRRLEKRNEKCAVVGGMKEQEFQEFNERYAQYLEDIVANPSKIRVTPEINAVSRVIVCGSKTA